MGIYSLLFLFAFVVFAIPVVLFVAAAVIRLMAWAQKQEDDG